MKPVHMKMIKNYAATLLLLLCITSARPAAYGQGCSVCTKTAQGLDNKSARGLNGGIIYLAFLPLVIIGSVGVIWWRSKNSQ